MAPRRRGARGARVAASPPPFPDLSSSSFRNEQQRLSAWFAYKTDLTASGSAGPEHDLLIQWPAHPVGVTDASHAQIAKFNSSVMTAKTYEIVVPGACASDILEMRAGSYIPPGKRSVPGDKRRLDVVPLAGMINFYAVARMMSKADLLTKLLAARKGYLKFVATKSLSEKERRKAVKQAWGSDPVAIGDDDASSADASSSAHSVYAIELSQQFTDGREVSDVPAARVANVVASAAVQGGTLSAARLAAYEQDAAIAVGPGPSEEVESRRAMNDLAEAIGKSETLQRLMPSRRRTVVSTGVACLRLAFGDLNKYALWDVAGWDGRIGDLSTSCAAAFTAKMENAQYGAPEDRTLAAMYFQKWVCETAPVATGTEAALVGGGQARKRPLASHRHMQTMVAPNSSLVGNLQGTDVVGNLQGTLPWRRQGSSVGEVELESHFACGSHESLCANRAEQDRQYSQRMLPLEFTASPQQAPATQSLQNAPPTMCDTEGETMRPRKVRATGVSTTRHGVFNVGLYSGCFGNFYSKIPPCVREDATLMECWISQGLDAKDLQSSPKEGGDIVEKKLRIAETFRKFHIELALEVVNEDVESSRLTAEEAIALLLSRDKEDVRFMTGLAPKMGASPNKAMKREAAISFAEVVYEHVQGKSEQGSNN